MYDLYIANKNYSSWSLRPWVLMRELAIPFREILVPFGGAKNPDAFRAFSPTGKVPCLVDGDITVWDSLAITEYVGERHAGVWPAEAAARAWARSAAAEMHSGFQALRNTCGMNCGLRINLHAVDAALERDLRAHRAALGRWARAVRRSVSDRHALLRGRCILRAGGVPHPDLRPAGRRRSAPLRRQLLALPSMQTWYAAALAETLRDEDHDAELRAAGAWREDLRAR